MVEAQPDIVVGIAVVLLTNGVGADTNDRADCSERGQCACNQFRFDGRRLVGELLLLHGRPHANDDRSWCQDGTTVEVPSERSDW